jgi:integral membrane sensor domain MASE1
MTEEKRSANFWFNLDIVLTEIGRWPIATLIVLTLLTAVIVFQPSETSLKFGALGNALMVAGYQLSLLGGKGMLLLWAYPHLHNKKFPGSYLMSTALVLAPNFVFFAIGLRLLAREHGDEESIAILLTFVLVSYPIFVVFFAAAMRIQHAMSPLQERISALIWKRSPVSAERPQREQDK